MDDPSALRPPGYASLTIWAISLCLIFPFLATWCVIGRFWARVSFKVPLKWDDWTILAALPLTIATCGAAIWAAVDGQVGRHDDQTTIPEKIQWEKAKFCLQVFHKAAVPMVKFSILLFYNRIFTNSKAFRYASWGIGLFVLFWFVGFETATIVQCLPISANWDVGSTHPGVCVNQQVMLTCSASTNVVSDVFILLMPWPILLKLQMPKNRKYGLLGLFLLGIFTCIAAIFHTVYVVLLGQPIGKKDPTHFMGYLVIWFSIEPCVGIICACLPTFGPLLARQLPLSRLTSLIKSYLQKTPFSRNSSQRKRGSEPKLSDELVSPVDGHFAKLDSSKVGGAESLEERIWASDQKAAKSVRQWEAARERLGV